MGNEFNLSQLASEGNSEVSITEYGTKNVSISSEVINENFIDIDNISRQYFQLMIKLNESPELRSFFSKEIYSDNTWQYLPTTGEIVAENYKSATYYGPTGNDTLTRHFMSDGLVVYKVYSDKNRSALESVVVITGPNQEAPINQKASCYLNEVKKQEQKQIDIVIRWGGCGMIIGEAVKLQLDPNIVWPKVEIHGTSDGSEFKVAVENLANQVAWRDTQPDAGEDAFGIGKSDKNFEQGSTKVVLEVAGKVEPSTKNIVLTLPYTCSSFDVLTGIKINGEEEILLYTT